MRKNIWIPNKLRRAVSLRDAGLCKICGLRAASATLDRWKIPKFKDISGAPFEIDHTIPLSKGGKTNMKNLILSCRACNRRKPRLSKTNLDGARSLVEKINSGSI